VNAKILAILFVMQRTHAHPRLDHPRKRMIQYAVTVIVALEGRGVLDTRRILSSGSPKARPVGGA